MRNLFVPSAVALLMIAGTVQASARSQADSWNGTYVGLDGGYGWGSVKQSSGTIGGPLINSTGSTNQDGAVVGGYAGYNWLLSPRWLVGAEGNMDWTDIGASSGAAGATNPTDLHWEGSFRGRFGFLATPSILLYATGGYSLIDGNLKTLNSPVEVHPTTFGGWTVGAGTEWALASGIVFRLQYRYSDYGAQRELFPAHGYDIGATPLVNTITAGVSFRL